MTTENRVNRLPASLGIILAIISWFSSGQVLSSQIAMSSPSSDVPFINSPSLRSPFRAGGGAGGRKGEGS